MAQLHRRHVLVGSAAFSIHAMIANTQEQILSTMQPFAKSDVFVGATLLNNPQDDHDGLGRIIQYDAELIEKGAPGKGEMRMPPVSVCHHVSTIGQRLSPTTR